MDDDYDNDYDNDGADGTAAVSRPDPTAFAVGAAPAKPAAVEDAAAAPDSAEAAEEAPPLELPEIAPGILQFSAIFASASVPKPPRRPMPARRVSSSKGRAGSVQLEQSDASRVQMAQEAKAVAHAAKSSPAALDVWARTQLRVMGMAGDSSGGGGGGGGGSAAALTDAEVTPKVEASEAGLPPQRTAAEAPLQPVAPCSLSQGKRRAEASRGGSATAI